MIHSQSKKKNNLLDDTMYVVALFGPLITIPQVISVWATPHVQGLSLSTWVLLCISSALWVGYGVIKRDKPLAINGVALFVLYVLIVAGIIAHR